MIFYWTLSNCYCFPSIHHNCAYNTPKFIISSLMLICLFLGCRIVSGIFHRIPLYHCFSKTIFNYPTHFKHQPCSFAYICHCSLLILRVCTFCQFLDFIKSFQQSFWYSASNIVYKDWVIFVDCSVSLCLTAESPLNIYY